MMKTENALNDFRIKQFDKNLMSDWKSFQRNKHKFHDGLYDLAFQGLQQNRKQLEAIFLLPQDYKVWSLNYDSTSSVETGLVSAASETHAIMLALGSHLECIEEMVLDGAIEECKKHKEFWVSEHPEMKHYAQKAGSGKIFRDEDILREAGFRWEGDHECYNCGHTLKKDASLCPECGHVAEKKCFQCKTPLEHNHTECSACSSTEIDEIPLYTVLSF